MDPFKTTTEAFIHTRAAAAVQDERLRQLKVKGYDCSHDDLYGFEELATAAAFYILPAWLDQDVCTGSDAGLVVQPLLQLVADSTWEGIFRDSGMEANYQEDATALKLRIDTLTRGLALGLAELERLMRLRESSAEVGAR